MRNGADNKQLRSFGLIVGGVFGLIAAWPLVLYRAEPRWWAVAAAVLLLLPAVIYPRALSRLHQGWMALGHVLGWVNTRIILGFIFYFVVTPTGAIRRLLGKDSMGKEFRADMASYRIARKPRAPSHLRRQY